MSDFLAILAERSLGQVPAIRPRLPARFEPEDLRSRAPADEAAGWAGAMEAGVPAQSSREPAVPPRPAAAPAPHPDISQPTPRPARGTPSAPVATARPQVRPIASGEPAPRATPIPRPSSRDDEEPPRSRRASRSASPDQPVPQPARCADRPFARGDPHPRPRAPGRARPCGQPSGRPWRGEARSSSRAGRRAPQRAAVARRPVSPRTRAARAADTAARGAAGLSDPCHHRPDRGARVRAPARPEVAAGQPAAR